MKKLWSWTKYFGTPVGWVEATFWSLLAAVFTLFGIALVLVSSASAMAARAAALYGIWNLWAPVLGIPYPMSLIGAFIGICVVQVLRGPGRAQRAIMFSMMTGNDELDKQLKPVAVGKPEKYKLTEAVLTDFGAPLMLYLVAYTAHKVFI
jgi:hypothetical protein